MKGEESNTRAVDKAEFLFFSRNAFNKILKLVLEVVTKRMESFDARWDLKSIFIQIIYSMLFTSRRCSSFLNKLLSNKIDVFTILTFNEAADIKIVLKWRRGNAYSICNSIIEKYLQLSQTNFPWKSLEFSSQIAPPTSGLHEREEKWFFIPLNDKLHDDDGLRLFGKFMQLFILIWRNGNCKLISASGSAPCFSSFLVFYWFSMEEKFHFQKRGNLFHKLIIWQMRWNKGTRTVFLTKIQFPFSALQFYRRFRLWNFPLTIVLVRMAFMSEISTGWIKMSEARLNMKSRDSRQELRKSWRVINCLIAG